MALKIHKTHHPNGLLIHGYEVQEHPLYGTWADMKSRCNNSNEPSWENYGGRGITYCEAWEHFSNFATDMWPKPDGFELDRIDNEKDYSKDNCRWATRFQNAQNKRVYKTNKLQSGGITKTKNGSFACRYNRDNVSYTLGRFASLEEAATFRDAFKAALTDNPDDARAMLVRRARLDSETGIRGISKNSDGYIVRKTIGAERVYLGHASDLDSAIKILQGGDCFANSAEASSALSQRARAHSSTGVRGLSKSGDGYVVRKTVGKERIYLGFAPNLEAAIALLDSAA